MNIKQLFALTALAVAGNLAMADDITIVQDNFVAQKSRADVKAELAQARADGTLPKFGDSDNSVPVAKNATKNATKTNGMTREQVRAELRATPKARVMTFNPAA